MWRKVVCLDTWELDSLMSKLTGSASSVSDAPPRRLAASPRWRLRGLAAETQVTVKVDWNLVERFLPLPYLFSCPSRSTDLFFISTWVFGWIGCISMLHVLGLRTCRSLWGRLSWFTASHLLLFLHNLISLLTSIIDVSPEQLRRSRSSMILIPTLPVVAALFRNKTLPPT